MRKLTMPVAVALLLSCTGTLAAPERPYAGQEKRAIKALSEADVAGLLEGKGMGYAKAAELNGYPGPKHVLELGDQLKLSAKQRAETQAIFERMQKSAQALGAELVAAQQALDKRFSDRSIDERSLAELASKIGELDGQLRAVHLRAHLEQRQLLNEQQLAQYQTLRGYSGAGAQHSGHHHH